RTHPDLPLAREGEENPSRPSLGKGRSSEPIPTFPWKGKEKRTHPVLPLKREGEENPSRPSLGKGRSSDNKNKKVIQMRHHEAIYFARALRKTMTPSEKIFWEKVRKRRLLGLRFLRQYKIEHSNVMNVRNFFFVDFYCHELRLIVEIDGSIHKKQKEYDLARESILREMKYKVYRIKNEEASSDLAISKFINYCEQLKKISSNK
ncbi:MAG TPA: DUF559 domain-containing protein, partial [Saprospiraceae bacterium]|nr:DUF559 domain-containing protein [Saprospiraceae bacterium]